MALLEIRDLSVTYDTARGPLRAVVGVDLDLDAGQILGIVGESGSGKTTVILSVLRLVPGRIESGRILLQGADLRERSPVEMRRIRGRRLGYVPQAAMNALNPLYKVGAQIGESLELHTDLRRRAAEGRVAELLEMVELDRDVASRYPHELSGGMRQRAVIAMALAPGPEVLLADEPTSGLDVLVRVQVLRLLTRLVGELGLALLLVSHDLRLVSRWCRTALVMYAGRVVQVTPAADLLSNSLHPYALALAASMPSLRGAADLAPTIRGEVPDLTFAIEGCPFHPRCPEALPICPQRPPLMVVRPGDRQVACHLHE